MGVPVAANDFQDSLRQAMRAGRVGCQFYSMAVKRVGNHAAGEIPKHLAEK